MPVRELCAQGGGFYAFKLPFGGGFGVICAATVFPLGNRFPVGVRQGQRRKAGFNQLGAEKRLGKNVARHGLACFFCQFCRVVDLGQVFEMCVASHQLGIVLQSGGVDEGIEGVEFVFGAEFRGL